MHAAHPAVHLMRGCQLLQLLQLDLLLLNLILEHDQLLVGIRSGVDGHQGARIDGRRRRLLWGLAHVRMRRHRAIHGPGRVAAHSDTHAYTKRRLLLLPQVVLVLEHALRLARGHVDVDEGLLTAGVAGRRAGFRDGGHRLLLPRRCGWFCCCRSAVSGRSIG